MDAKEKCPFVNESTFRTQEIVNLSYQKVHIQPNLLYK